MMDLHEALAIAEAAFPHGPEELAKRLKIPVRSTAMGGCDGWCLRRGKNIVIRLNSNTSETRQRFTLAHELAHLLLGIEPEILGHSAEPFASKSEEEKKVNRIAGRLLLPKSKLKELVTSVPVDAAALKKAARRAHVSEEMTACRIASSAKALGLQNAAVLAFADDALKWAWSKTLEVPESLATELLVEARAVHPKLHRQAQDDGDIITAFVMGRGNYTVMFVQLLPPEVAKKKTRGESIRELADWLFENDQGFCNSLNGCISVFKTKHAGTLTLSEAVNGFTEHYSPRLAPPRRARMLGPKGQRYLRLRLSEWFE